MAPIKYQWIIFRHELNLVLLSWGAAHHDSSDQCFHVDSFQFSKLHYLKNQIAHYVKVSDFINYSQQDL